MASVIQSIHEQMQSKDANLALLVPRTVILASLLRQKNVATWLKRELEGYADGDVLPEYRRAENATLVAWMPGQGWIKAPVADQVSKKTSRFDLYDGIQQFEKNYAKIRKAGGQRIDPGEKQLKELQQLTNLDVQLCLAVPADAYARVLLAVRIAIGIWTKTLMHRGIEGKGMVFSNREREAAGSITERLDELLAEAGKEATRAAEAARASHGSILSRLLGKH